MHYDSETVDKQSDTDKDVVKNMKTKLFVIFWVVLEVLSKDEIVIDMVEDTIKEFNIKCTTFIQDEIETSTRKEMRRNLIKKLNVQIRFTNQENKNILRERAKYRNFP